METLSRGNQEEARLSECAESGRVTKQQVLEQARVWGLTTAAIVRSRLKAIGTLLRNQLYAGSSP